MRWLDPEVTVAATFEPVTLAQAKAAQRIDSDDENTNLEGYLKAARGIVEDRTGQRLATQTVKLRTWALDCSTFILPIAPVQSVDEITYVDNDGATQTVSTDVYETALYGLRPIVSLKYGQSWPAHRAGLGSIVITCVVGYEEGAAPDPIQQAIKLAFGDFTNFREQQVAGTLSDVASVAVDSLIINHKRSLV